MSEKVVIRTDKAPLPLAGAPYSQAIRFENLVFVSGQLPVDPATGTVVPGGITEQTEQTMRNMQAVLEAAGSSLDKLLKTTVFLTTRDNWAAMNEVYARYVGDRRPARSAVEVGRLAFGSLLEIEAIAHL
jgi:2-iminobutanoate/2-iminopropanoate deaminase